MKKASKAKGLKGENDTELAQLLPNFPAHVTAEVGRICVMEPVLFGIRFCDQAAEVWLGWRCPDLGSDCTLALLRLDAACVFPAASKETKSSQIWRMTCSECMSWQLLHGMNQAQKSIQAVPSPHVTTQHACLNLSSLLKAAAPVPNEQEAA